MVSQRMILIMILKMTPKMTSKMNPKMNHISEPPNEPQNVSIKAITRARAARAPGGEETASAHHHDSNNRANRTQSQACLIERCSRSKRNLFRKSRLLWWLGKDTVYFMIFTDAVFREARPLDSQWKWRAWSVDGQCAMLSAAQCRPAPG